MVYSGHKSDSNIAKLIDILTALSNTDHTAFTLLFTRKTKREVVALWLRCLPLNPGIKGLSPTWVITMFLHMTPALLSYRKVTKKWLI
jgi:hypothetical protein